MPDDVDVRRKLCRADWHTASRNSPALKRVARARADYDRSIALHATPVRSYMGRADLYERMGERSRAIADFQKVLEIGPDMLPQYAKQCEDALKRLGTRH